MERASNNESETRFIDILFREQMNELDNDDLLNRQSDTERDVIDRRFFKMNRPIGELTNLVLVPTQQFSSNTREGNGLHYDTYAAKVEFMIKCKVCFLLNENEPYSSQTVQNVHCEF